METIYRDYHIKDVNFYYVYKKLAHPEANGFVDPISIEERVKHVATAKEKLKTEFSWICDNMENDLKTAMGGAPNSEFLIDKAGKILVARQWSDPNQLRKDLAELVGESETVTKVSDLGYQIDPASKPGDKVSRGVVKRLELPGDLSAVKTKLTSNSDGENYYVKLRAEATPDLLKGQPGKLYLGFHIDPIYEHHWNNLAGSVEVELTMSNGETINKTLSKPEVDADVDPREALIEIDGKGAKGPIEVTGKFFVCDDAETVCLDLTQTYEVILEIDRDAGRRRAAGGRRGGGEGRGRRGGGNMAQRMMQRDQDGDGKISREEMPSRGQQMFDRLDTNKDGFLDQDEMKAQSRGGRRGG